MDGGQVGFWIDLLFQKFDLLSLRGHLLSFPWQRMEHQVHRMGHSIDLLAF